MPPLSILRETPWETRNLGVPSYAVRDDFFDAPDFSALGNEMHGLAVTGKRLFVVARLSARHLPSVTALQQLGFYLVECTFAPTMALYKNPVLLQFERNPSAVIPARYQREDLTFMTLSSPSPEWAETLTAMAQSAFADDRFHVDHRCPPEIADRRFAYWMSDLTADSKARFDVLHLKGKPIAFVARKGDYQVVSGFASGYAATGLGEFFWLSTCAACKAEGETFVHSVVSCNNLQSINLFARCGFRFRKTGYSFHFWENPPV